MPRRIPQPRDAAIRQRQSELSLVWNRSFGRDRSESFDTVQKFIDSECIRLMVPYTPARNNILYKTAVEGTKIGEGAIHYTAPYARYQYYGKLMISSVTGSAYAVHGESKVLTDVDLTYSTSRHPRAQKMWFETMKTNHKEQILRGAAVIARRE